MYLLELIGTVVSRLDFCAGDLGLILAGAEFPTGVHFWPLGDNLIVSGSTSLDWELGEVDTCPWLGWK